MKTSFYFRLQKSFITGLLFTGLLVFSNVKSANASAPNMGVSFQVFYDALMPYGDWVNDPTHGYIWVPYVDAGFQPYRTNGYWVNSRFGNTWVSNYEWGWAPFHYGRWFIDDFYGWAWVPGYEWGPAWVEWRTGRGYYGWAPLWPRVGVHVSFQMPYHHWVFVPRRRFLARNFYNYCLPPRNIGVIYNRTTIINNTYVYNNRTYVAGPSRRELQRVTRGNVPVYEVSNSNRPGRANVENNRVNLYRPQIENTANARRGGMARPERVLSTEEFRTRRGSDATPATESGRSARQAENQVNARGNAVQPSPATRREIAGTNSRLNDGSASPSARNQNRQVSPSSSNRENSRTTQPSTPNTARRDQVEGRNEGLSSNSDRTQLSGERSSNARGNASREVRSNQRTNASLSRPTPNEDRRVAPSSTNPSRVGAQPNAQQRQIQQPAQRQTAPRQSQVRPNITTQRQTAPRQSQVRQNTSTQRQAAPRQSQVRPNTTTQRQTAPRQSQVRSRSSSNQRQVAPSSRAPQVRNSQPAARSRSSSSPSVGRSNNQVRQSYGSTPSRSSGRAAARTGSRGRGN
ncbi:DUF6600 domain-containing protein [Pleomorphovibrio marinus]|uniref:DUF6600 domain-containing protein n=1 Tax=Pleomorphovibrio marinus TaxID=2164132 RepID=UPI000E0C2097|nr:DUF6600 domain-containing protein [Pleomorphovibrio marinus]